MERLKLAHAYDKIVYAPTHPSFLSFTFFSSLMAWLSRMFNINISAVLAISESVSKQTNKQISVLGYPLQYTQSYTPTLSLFYLEKLLHIGLQWN